MITKTRRSFDDALRALPVTQHGRIWDLYLQFAKAAGGETAIRINRRYLKVIGNTRACQSVNVVLTFLFLVGTHFCRELYRQSDKTRTLRRSCFETCFDCQ